MGNEKIAWMIGKGVSYLLSVYAQLALAIINVFYDAIL